MNRVVNGTPTTYTVNDFNQVTGIGGLSASYDANGNRTSQVYDASGPKSYLYTWDDENQLISVATDTTYTPAANRWKSEFIYDGRGRLRIRRDYTWPSGGWVLQAETRYLYDGMRVVQERTSANTPTVAYTRGKDLGSAGASPALAGAPAGQLEAAGGIGGLLARSHGYSGGTWSTHSFYHADGNGNVTALPARLLSSETCRMGGDHEFKFTPVLWTRPSALRGPAVVELRPSENRARRDKRCEPQTPGQTVVMAVRPPTDWRRGI